MDYNIFTGDFLQASFIKIMHADIIFYVGEIPGGEIDFVAEKMAILHTFRWRCQLCLRMFWNGN